MTVATLIKLDISPITRTVLTCSAYARGNIEEQCFMKVSDAGKAMKSEIVSAEAPQAISWDWLRSTE